MADDAAAPDGELTETAKEVQPADEDAAERVDTAEGDACLLYTSPSPRD